MRKIKVAILKNEDPIDHRPWVDACNDYKEDLSYKVIDLSSSNWLNEIIEFDPVVCLLKPSGKTSLFRQQYQERVEIIEKDLGLKIFPTYNEVRIYENKRYFAYWAMANDVPHPPTYVYYSKIEALSHIKSCAFPLVAKLNVGASGKGVKILSNIADARKYISAAFNEGIASKTGPKLKSGKLIQRAWQKLTHPTELKNRLKTYSSIAKDRQKGFLIFQDYISHDFEWRAVRIGDSFFAHKKLKVGEKTSGTLLKDYENPPLELMDFVKRITDQFNFRSVAVDIFEDHKGNYLINEIQCIFGQSDPYQMLVDNKPGRYLYLNDTWVFEEGDFNKNQSFNLRVEYIIKTLRSFE